MDKSIVSKNFSKNALHYDNHSDVQSECGAELVKMLPSGGFSHILEIGCGTGSFTEVLAGKYEGAVITAVDIAGGMVDRARGKFNGGRFRFLKADGEMTGFSREFDMVASNASLQWFNDMDTAAKRLADALLPGGYIGVSIYGPDTFKELQQVLSACFSERPRLSSSRFAEKDILARIFNEHFEMIDIVEKNYRVSFSSLLDLLRAIKLSGTVGEGLGGKVFLGKDALKELEKRYLIEYGDIIATHQVFFFVGKIRKR